MRQENGLRKRFRPRSWEWCIPGAHTTLWPSGTMLADLTHYEAHLFHHRAPWCCSFQIDGDVLEGLSCFLAIQPTKRKMLI